MKTKILGSMVVVVAFFMFAGIASASTAEIIQPASIIYNENMTVNGELNVKSLRVGSEGVGGVTYFNGTIVNVGQDIPVTFGDDVRIDGEIWRGPSKGQADGQPLKFSDSLTPTDTNNYNLGFSNKRWKDLYLAGLLYGEDIIVGRELWGGTRKGIIDGDDPLFVSDSMYPTLDNINNLGSADNRWNDLHLSGSLYGVDAELSGALQGVDATFTGNVDLSGATVTGLPTPSTDADTLDGIDSTGFAPYTHPHTGYLPIDGSSAMTGNIVMSGAQTVDGIDLSTISTTYLPLAGGTMTGNLNLDGNYITGNVIFSGDLSMTQGITTTSTSYINFGINTGFVVPWTNGQDIATSCNQGQIHVRTDAGNVKLFVCDDAGAWISI